MTNAWFLAEERIIAGSRADGIWRSTNLGSSWSQVHQPPTISEALFNDGTVEGIRHVSKPLWGVQFHPEARPGPVDTAWIFDDFTDHVKRGIR